MLTLMNYNIHNLNERAALVDIYIAGQQVVANIPIQELNIKLISKTNVGEIICESLVCKEFEHSKYDDLLLNEGESLLDIDKEILEKTNEESGC